MLMRQLLEAKTHFSAADSGIATSGLPGTDSRPVSKLPGGRQDQRGDAAAGSAITARCRVTAAAKFRGLDASHEAS